MVWNVAILALIPGLTLAAQPGTAAKAGNEVPKGLRTTTTETTERIALPRLHGPLSVSTDALARRVRLTPSKKDNISTLAAHIGKHAGAVCPRVVLNNGAIELICRSSRFEVQITAQGKESYLDINELRGLPWRAGPDAAPNFSYDPWRVGLGQSCPGKSPGVRGECALQDGNQLEAAIQFRAALETTARQLACVRLGDLAVATGDPITGAGWYRRAGSFGFFGRIADARQCELDGRCLQSTAEVLRAFDPSGFPEPLRAESLMRAARAEAYMGRLPSAIHIIARQTGAHGIGSVCREGGEMICRRIVLEGMRAAVASRDPMAAIAAHHAQASGNGPTQPSAPLDKDERAALEELMETYLALPSWEKGPFAVEMAAAAAALSVRLGAPAFGGNLLASLAPEVPDAQLSDHLLLAAETFLLGENWPRARIIAEYAQSRLGGKGKNQKGAQSLQSPRWVAVYRALSWHAEQDEVSPAVHDAIEAEFTATLAELKKARETRDRVESLLKVTGAAKVSRPANAESKAAEAKSSAGAGGAAGRSSPASETTNAREDKAPTTVAKNLEDKP